MNPRDFWDRMYSTKAPADLSWTQPDPRTSLALIAEFCPPRGSVIDIGGGASPLAGRLLSLGYSVTVLDISPTAMSRAASLLGPRANDIRWLAADVTQHPDLGTFDLWHDRAVFHFLTQPADRAAYADLLSRTIPPGNYAIIATFTPDGPAKCSGLDVVGYDAPALAVELGASVSLVRSVPETHLTPWGQPQPFQYSVFRRADAHSQLAARGNSP